MFLAFVTATLFFRSEMNQDTVLDGVKYLGALFMGVIVINFNCTVELGMVTKRLPIFYKQRELLELPGWPLVCSVFLTSLPVSLMESGLWTFSTYYAIGYAPSAIRYSPWQFEHQKYSLQSQKGIHLDIDILSKIKLCLLLL
jgi:hypothetical protein